MKRLLLLATFVATGAQAATLPVQVLDRDGQPVADAVVVLTPSRPSTLPRLMPDAAVIGQEKMQFVPSVTVVPVGARLTFMNNDSWEHHVRGSAAGALQFSARDDNGFELRLDGKASGKPAQSVEVVVKQAGAVLLGCHIHGSMRGFVYVSDSPWALKTGADGMARFDGLPDGEVRVRVWQADQMVELPARTVVANAATPKVEFKLQVTPRRRRA